MIAIIEKITTKLTRLTCISENEWSIQKNKFSSLQEAGRIIVVNVNDFYDAKGLVVPRRHLFKEYISSSNRFEIIIETFEEQK